MLLGSVAGIQKSKIPASQKAALFLQELSRDVGFIHPHPKDLIFFTCFTRFSWKILSLSVVSLDFAVLDFGFSLDDEVVHFWPIQRVFALGKDTWIFLVWSLNVQALYFTRPILIIWGAASRFCMPGSCTNSENCPIDPSSLWKASCFFLKKGKMPSSLFMVVFVFEVVLEFIWPIGVLGICCGVG